MALGDTGGGEERRRGYDWGGGCGRRQVPGGIGTERARGAGGGFARARAQRDRGGATRARRGACVHVLLTAGDGGGGAGAVPGEKNSALMLYAPTRCSSRPTHRAWTRQIQMAQLGPVLWIKHQQQDAF